MKKIIALSLILCSVFVFSQNKTIVSNWTSFVQSVNVQNIQNWKFRVSAKIRKENDNNSKCAIWARVDNTDAKVGFFENQAYSDIKVTTDWKTFEIKGVIDPEGKTLNIGAFAQDNGDFYFDDFKLEVLDPKTVKWTNIPLKNAGFEENLASEKTWAEGIGRNKITHVKNFSISTSDDKPFSGKKSLLIKARNIIGSMPHGKFADVNGIKMYYETYGEGEPLLMLHGNGQSINAFMNQVDVFQRNIK
ncbi:alpha/beta fold hydrolase [Chryseobacterium arachidis]|uniref:alpha/beta fold hydrolase n=1 Tax=Chryseobacterium arachidis TaxID=1416778 RepID=UPI0036151F38